MYGANGQIPVNYTVEANGKRLRVKGCLLHVIERVISTHGLIWETIEHWSNTGVIVSVQHHRTREALALKLCGSISNESRVHSFPDLTIFDRWWSLVKPGSSGFLGLQLDGPADAFNVSSALVSWERIFVLTKDRRMGWVPENAIPGDVIAMLTGARVPIVLRPEEGGYTVIGDAYVHGIMDGEAMRDDSELEYLTLV
jgi:hypothetical protein